MLMPSIPRDAAEVVRSAFALANRTVAHRICRLPNTWETSLDQAFIDALVGVGGPVVVGSGWTVRIDTHFLGGGRHWPDPDWAPNPYRRWEIADIGVIVMIRNGSELVRTKLALFQSKRLYPNEQPMDEIEPVLGKSHGPVDELYNEDEQSLFEAYRVRFKVGSKPAAHLRALARITDDELVENLPLVYDRLVEAVEGVSGGLCKRVPHLS